MTHDEIVFASDVLSNLQNFVFIFLTTNGIEIMKFDDIFEYVGEMGTYQWLMFVLASLLSVFGVEAISVNFLAGYMDHWCQVDALTDFPHEQQKYVAIPVGNDGVYANCEQYDINYANFTPAEIRDWNRTLFITNNTPIIACNQWVYDRSEFVSTAVSKFDFVCSRQDLVPLISTLYLVGVAVGSFVSGPLSDRIGRRPTILIFLLVKMAAALMSSFANNFVVYFVARVFLGIGTFSSYLVAYVLVMELVGPIHRTFLGVGFQMMYSVGMLMLSGMAFAIRDDKWLQIAYVVPAALFFTYHWLLPESPRWLMLRGSSDKANKLIRQMAAVNNRELPKNFDSKNLEEDDVVPEKNCTHIFKSKVLRNRSMIINLYWFTVNLIYYALSFNIGYLSGSIFVNTVISGAVEIPANILCILMCNWKRTGRRLTCCISLVLAGISCFIRIPLILKGFDKEDTAFSFVGRAFVTVGFSGIYVYAAELFPTEVRNAGLAFAAIFAQISGAVSPYVGGPLSRVWGPLPALIFGVLSLVFGFAILALPETLGQQMFETVEEAEEFNGESVNINNYGSFPGPGGSGDPQLLPNSSTKQNPDPTQTVTKTGIFNPGFIMTEKSTRL